MFREIHILKTKNPSNIFKYFYEPAVMAEQDGLTGSAWGDWANYTASPLRAFENELGVQAPVGFWDPAGLSSDGSVENFKRRRATEIKHGRISMLATMGYITPELTGKFPGFLSPSAGLKFADVPNGLAAISKVPAGGWAQIAAYMAFCEVSQDQSPGTAAFAGDFGWKLITSDDPEVKKTKLNAELANGRLAMMAIIGMFFQARCSNWMEVMISVRVLDCHVFYTDGQESTDCMYINAMICIDIRCQDYLLFLHGCFNSRWCRR